MPPEVEQQQEVPPIIIGMARILSFIVFLALAFGLCGLLVMAVKFSLWAAFTWQP